MNDWTTVDQAGSMIEEEMTDAGKTTGPKQAKGGTFAPADVPLIKRALHVYLLDCLRSDTEEQHPDVTPIANLLHRLGRIA